MTTTVVLLSGGFDSTIALFWALHNTENEVVALSIDYDQRHKLEVKRARGIVIVAKRWLGDKADRLYFKPLYVPGMFSRTGSLLADKPVATYTSVEEAVKHNTSDTAYIPLRNAVLVSIAAHWLLFISPSGGCIITGFRGRANDPSGGFPDGSALFSDAMTEALSIGAGCPIEVWDPLNRDGRRSRVDALNLAQSLPGCMEALSWSLTCFNGTEPPCGKCLPCLRRAQGFAQFGVPDPLMVRLGLAMTT